MILRWLKYYWSAITPYNVHSPFVFELCQDVLFANDQFFYETERLKEYRTGLLKNANIIEVTDLGAGSKKMAKNVRSVAQIVKHAGITHKKGELLFKLVNYFKPSNILELGTSVGLGTLYMHKADTRIPLHTIEGCPNTAAFSKVLFDKTGAKSITNHVGDFSNVLPGLLTKLGGIDFAYMDGNHQHLPTIEYFNLILPYCHNDTVIVFDDIHWSDGMEKAWAEICANEAVSLTIDLFDLGLVFFRKEIKQKANFSLIETFKKPWKALG